MLLLSHAINNTVVLGLKKTVVVILLLAQQH